MRKAALLIGGACGMALVLPAPSRAQNLGSATDASEIIVTARKRQESILKVPVVASVVSAETLNNYAITDMTRLSTKVPGLLVGAAVLGAGVQISIRGVGTSAQDQGIDQSVSLNVDGLPLSQGLAFRAAMFDLAQLEVLKGPQALFYGKNAPGGVISLRSADPGNDYEIIGRTGYEFEAREWRHELILSGPLTETLGLRLAGQYGKMKGFFKNVAVGQPATGGLDPRYRRMDNTENHIVRATAVWKPTRNFSTRLKANITKDHVRGSSGSAAQLVHCPDGIVPPPSGVQFLAPTEDCKLNRTFQIVDLDPTFFPAMTFDGTPFFRLKQRYGTLEMNYAPGDNIDLVSVTGYYWNRLRSGINATSTGFAGGAIAVENAYRRRETTQEFRAETSFDSPVNFSTGAFYQDGEVSNYILTAGNSAYRLPAKLAEGRRVMKIKTYSLFGQARWKLSEQFEFAAGVRWADESRRIRQFNLVTGTAAEVASPTPGLSSKTWSPEVTLTYTPTDDLTIFGSLKQGYKSGSFSLGSTVTPGLEYSFGDERVRGGEVGLKARMLDRSLFVNVAAFLYKYDGLQVGATILDPNNIPGLRVVNAAGSKIYGLDFDFTYRPPIDGLSITGSVNYAHARFTELVNAPCYGGQTVAAGCGLILNPQTGLASAQDLSGSQLIRAPDWQLAGGFSYETQVGNGLKAELGGDYVYTSSYPGTLSDRPQSFQKGFAKFNASVSIGDNSERWKLQFLANNIFNKITAGSFGNSNFANGAVLGGQITGGDGRGPAGLDEITAFAQRGRELWIRLTLRPFGR